MQNHRVLGFCLVNEREGRVGGDKGGRERERDWVAARGRGRKKIMSKALSGKHNPATIYSGLATAM